MFESPSGGKYLSSLFAIERHIESLCAFYQLEPHRDPYWCSWFTSEIKKRYCTRCVLSQKLNSMATGSLFFPISLLPGRNRELPLLLLNNASELSNSATVCCSLPSCESSVSNTGFCLPLYGIFPIFPNGYYCLLDRNTFWYYPWILRMFSDGLSGPLFHKIFWD